MNNLKFYGKSKLKNLIIKLTFIAIFILCIVFCKATYATEEQTLTNTTRAYFCSEITKTYGNGDCILLENYDKNGNKVYGLIDTGRKITVKDKNGENSTVVVEYLKNHGVDKLEFLLITHSHGDHNGDALSVMNNFEIDRIYMKEFDKTLVTDGTTQTTYENIIKLAIEKNIKVIGTSYLSIISAEITPSRSEDFINNYVPSAKEENFEGFYYNSDTDNNIIFSFGSAKLRIFNWEMFDEDGNQYITGITTDSKREIVSNENNNSLAVLLTQGSKKALFSGDMNNLDKNTETGRTGDEDRLKNDIGKIDFLKIGHHGYRYSNTDDYINVLHPNYAVITNDIGGAYKDTCKWLEENNVDYLYTTVDDYGITATITQNEVYLGLETAECFKNINGELYYIPANSEYKNYNQNTYKVKYQEKNIEVNNWSELKNAIEQNANEIVSIDAQSKLCTLNSLTIQINSNGDWTATDTINIKEYQKITITSSDDVTFLRNADLKEKSLFYINGELNIGKENMTSSITINGNKENVDSSSTLIKIENGKLNIYDNVILCGNMNKTTKRTSSTTQYYASFGSAIYCSNGTINMYGGKIMDNNTDIALSHALPKSIATYYSYSSYGTGVYMTNNSVFNMYGGEISNNTAENHSVVTTNSDYTISNLSRGVTQGISGVAIYGTNSELKLVGGKIVGNKAKNYSETNIKTATNSTINTDIYALNTSIYGVGIYLASSKCTIKDNFTISNNIAEEYSKIYIEKDTKVNNSVDVGIRGMQAYFSTSSVEIEGLNVSGGQGTLNVTSENNGQIGASGTSSISPSIVGGGIDIYNSIFSIKNLNVNNCMQGIYVSASKGSISNSSLENNVSSRYGGALYATGVCNIEINNTLFKGNQSACGGAIYIANDKSYTELNNVDITNNNTTMYSGGGIYAYGNLVISGNETRISNNHAYTYGGGVMVKTVATLNDGIIENNIAEGNSGGGIRVDGKLIMNGGKITGNTAKATGGGIDFTTGQVYLNSGTVSGNMATKAGNELYPEENVALDKIPPIVTIPELDKSWTNKNVVVTIMAEDEETGIKEVKVNNQTVQKLNELYTYEISENGTYEVSVTDNAGNETIEQITVTNIDKIAPIISGVLENTVYNTEITINAIDNESGIKNVKLIKNNSEINYQLGTPITESGNYEIEIEDNVSNKTNIKFSIDRSLKNDEILIDGISTEWTNSNQKIIITINNQIKSIRINKNEVKLIDGKYELTVSENSRLLN